MKNLTLPACILLLTTISACGSPVEVEMPAPPPEPFVNTEQLEAQAAMAVSDVPVLVATAAQASAAIGQRVRLLGTAQDAKLSAVVNSDELLVYCMMRADDGLLVEARWPDGAIDQPVAVTGILEQSEQFSAAVDADGAISQGAEGPILAVVDFEIELIETAEPVPEPVSEPLPEPEPEPVEAPLPE